MNGPSLEQRVVIASIVLCRGIGADPRWPVLVAEVTSRTILLRRLFAGGDGLCRARWRKQIGPFSPSMWRGHFACTGGAQPVDDALPRSDRIVPIEATLIQVQRWDKTPRVNFARTSRSRSAADPKSPTLVAMILARWAAVAVRLESLPQVGKLIHDQLSSDGLGRQRIFVGDDHVRFSINGKNGEKRSINGGYTVRKRSENGGKRWGAAPNAPRSHGDTERKKEGIGRE